MTDPPSPLPLAVLGVARFGDLGALPALVASAGARLVALAEPDPALREAILSALPGTPLLPLDDILADASIAAVVVGAPTVHHGPVAVAAFEAGKHVALDAPLAASVADGRAVVQAWAAAGTVGVVGREAPRDATLEATLRGADDLLTSVARPAPAAPWRLDPDEGGGCVFELVAGHVQMLAALLGSRPVSVRGTVETGSSTEDAADLEVAFESGPRVRVRASFGGEEAAARVEVPSPDGTRTLQLPPPSPEMDPSVVGALVRAVRGEAPAAATPAAALDALVAADAVRISAKWRRALVRIELDESPPIRRSPS